MGGAALIVLLPPSLNALVAKAARTFFIAPYQFAFAMQFQFDYNPVKRGTKIGAHLPWTAKLQL
jgi:hypothetical protein